MEHITMNVSNRNALYRQSTDYADLEDIQDCLILYCLSITCSSSISLGSEHCHDNHLITSYHKHSGITAAQQNRV